VGAVFVALAAEVFHRLAGPVLACERGHGRSPDLS
jgi:hypothetical protein